MRTIRYSLEEFAKVEAAYREKVKEFHSAHAEAEVIKEMSKDVLAQVMKKLDDAQKKKSVAELERLARCTEEWSEFRSGQWAAIRKEGEKKSSMLAAKTAWDTIQSGLSYKKAELAKLSG